MTLQHLLCIIVVVGFGSIVAYAINETRPVVEKDTSAYEVHHDEAADPKIADGAMNWWMAITKRKLAE